MNSAGQIATKVRPGSGIPTIPFSPDLEQPEADETATARELCKVLRSIMETTAANSGHGLRAVHAKSHALLEGTMDVSSDLPPALAQGMFSKSGSFRAYLRLSTIPGDVLDDRVSVPRGVAIKIIGVEGERLPGSEGDSTQDFVLVDAPAFSAPTASAFLGNLKLLAKTTDRAEWAKIALSKVLRQVEKGVELAGGKSALITTLGGHPLTHPLGDMYFSQTPFRYGDYVAKFSLAPVSPNLAALKGVEIALAGRENGLRDEIAEVVRSEPTVWNFRVQLLTDLQLMPIEDSSVVWPESESAFQTVATLTVPPQANWTLDRSRVIDDRMAFSVWHGLAAHQPLGSINRVRQGSYAMSAAHRAQTNGCPILEPTARVELPMT